MKEYPFAADPQVFNNDEPSTVNGIMVNVPTAWADRRGRLHLIEDHMKAIVRVLYHVGHFIVWYIE